MMPGYCTVHFTSIHASLLLPVSVYPTTLPKTPKSIQRPKGSSSEISKYKTTTERIPCKRPAP